MNKSNGFAVEKTIVADGTRGKYIVVNQDLQVFFSVEGSGAYLRVADLDGNNAREYHYTTLAQKVKVGKNTVALDEEYAYVALSDRGVAKINLNTGELVASFQPKGTSKN